MSLNVPITDDNVFERIETFSVTVDQTSQPGIVMVVPMCRLDVTIVDDDCKLFHLAIK